MNNRLDRERRSRAHRRASRGEAAAPEPAAAQTAAEPPARGRSLWLVLLLCLAGSTAVTFVVFKLALTPAVPPELVGSWEVAAGPLRGWSLDFRNDGTAVATRYERGKKIVTDYSARVEGNTLSLTTRDEKTGKDDTVTQTIVELTADELVIRDEDQITYHMKRAAR
jgi:uncharacterized protein (TIGR03066 family)